MEDVRGSSTQVVSSFPLSSVHHHHDDEHQYETSDIRRRNRRGFRSWYFSLDYTEEKRRIMKMIQADVRRGQQNGQSGSQSGERIWYLWWSYFSHPSLIWDMMKREKKEERENLKEVTDGKREREMWDGCLTWHKVCFKISSCVTVVCIFDARHHVTWVEMHEMS